MTTMTVPASDVRLSPDVRCALEHRRLVTVVRHDRPSFVVLHPDDFELVRSVLEEMRSGKPIPISRLLTDDDFAVMAMDDDGDARGWEILGSVE